MTIHIYSHGHHRNAICDTPFEVVLFHDSGPESGFKLAILFEQEGHCAVLDIEKLAYGGCIAFKTNSWRGDPYEPLLRKAIKEACRQLKSPTETNGDDDEQLLRKAIKEACGMMNSPIKWWIIK